MYKFVINIVFGSIIGFVKSNKIVGIEFSKEKLGNFHDVYTANFYYKIKEYLEGNDVLDEIPYKLYYKNEFEKDVLMALKKVKFGQVVSYKELAILSGYPYAARAVGSIMASNHLPLIFPCHRVIKNDRSIGKYSGGVEFKRYFLEIEGIKIKGDKVYKKL
ncbi:methylated-DNA-[protein]-cysteine S-methyltransferase [Marinitoga hydrogenitolerans DSM 16785]|uniref:Methylated-DNA--protein-cysteine methyltransferase n=1 Tax=Marinitoga hydrogenitolerans (strain DSM 16785 / JCM 12826 / AT1271) TaxID=1122195 RepID=A0A1M4UMH1_MARH1|nr:methylated-DNA--[protein]-cysteine S-methyltransferase [Marinitoga hydrogenitolerans]SHE57961.1 methylated-DNA-[protein]-cysteine S-methyltransferase [Marinitoga hydrogenitolerans DSM 16785]